MAKSGTYLLLGRERQLEEPSTQIPLLAPTWRRPPSAFWRREWPRYRLTLRGHSSLGEESAFPLGLWPLCFLRGCFPGNPAGFSWVRSRKVPRMPLASDTLDSPYLSRNRSAADSACFQRW